MMKRHYILAVLAGLLSASPLLAQNEMPQDTSYWKKKTEFGVNLNQGSFSSNWTGGAVSSVAFGIYLNALGEYKKGKDSWRNDFQAQYGIVRNKGQQSRKSVDRLFFDTKYGRQIADKWSLIANANFLSQFTPGYEYKETSSAGQETNKISGFFSPAYITEAIGVEYKPVPYFFVTLSPGAIRQTIVSDLNLHETFPKNYGVPVGKKIRNEVALMQIVANFDKDIAKNVNLKCRYLMYANYKKLGAIDNRLDAMLTAKINQYWNANLGVIAIYDQDQSTDIQFAQSMSIGFLYTF